MEKGIVSQKKKRAEWVDAAKLAAILAVLLDHTHEILYQSHQLGFFSLYNVSLFILLMGVTTYWSYRKADERRDGSRSAGAVLREESLRVLRKCLGIFLPYLLATTVYFLVLFDSYDFSIYWYYLWHFSLSAPFYYVFLYMQLVVVSPFLYAFVKLSERRKWLWIVGAVVILVISSLTTNHTNIADIYGGGGKLFGGTYLFLLYLGMLFGAVHDKLVSRLSGSGRKAGNLLPAGVGFLVSLGFTLAWWQFFARNEAGIDAHLPFGPGFNPPSISLTLFACGMGLTVFFLGQVVDRIDRKALSFGFSALAWLGKHTLYIFLWHRFFLDIVFPWFQGRGVVIGNPVLKWIVYFGVMIGGSLLIEQAVKLAKSIPRRLGSGLGKKN
jgi:fucose 4-O-acetylase-like acetyltransferase